MSSYDRLLTLMIDYCGCLMKHTQMFWPKMRKNIMIVIQQSNAYMFQSSLSKPRHNWIWQPYRHFLSFLPVTDNIYILYVTAQDIIDIVIKIKYMSSDGLGEISAKVMKVTIRHMINPIRQISIIYLPTEMVSDKMRTRFCQIKSSDQTLHQP